MSWRGVLGWRWDEQASVAVALLSIFLLCAVAIYALARVFADAGES